MDRNLILAIVLSMGILFGWDLFVAGPQRKAAIEAREAAAQAQQAGENQDLSDFEGAGLADAPLSLEEALAKAPGRVPIRTPKLDGSINLQGGRLDDLRLLDFHLTLDPESPKIRLLSPREAEHGHYVEQGWAIGNKAGDKAVWTAPEGAVLTPDTPLTLTREQDGVHFEKKISVDENYMFVIEQTVRNQDANEKDLTPYAVVIERGSSEASGRSGRSSAYIMHEGPLGVVGSRLYERKYNTLKKNKNKAVEGATGVGGWVGITNKYWLAAAIPPQDEEMTASLKNVGDENEPIYRAFYSLTPRRLAPGESLTLTSHIFGGVKDVDILQSYEAKPEKGGLGVTDLDKAIDWGKLFILTRPMAYTLNYFGDLVGNFGVAILILTVIIKLLLFPLANKGYDSMSKMKKLQPKIEELRKRYADDKMKMQQEMMDLYKKEKMNPMAGCLPILFQMPIFYALYKTLFMTVEMRQAPFVLWIKDLSAPDPTTIFNLFGLLPFDPTSAPVIGAFLGIGVLPLLMGVAMWFQTKLNPPPADPVQAQIFGMMPFVFVFIFAPFAAGLVLYWFWNTALSILQQWFIMKRNGVTIDWGERLKFPGRKNTPAPGE